jgi:hypothetical protein
MMVAAIYDTTISLMMEAAEELGEGDFFGDNRGEGGMGDSSSSTTATATTAATGTTAGDSNKQANEQTNE